MALMKKLTTVAVALLFTLCAAEDGFLAKKEAVSTAEEDKAFQEQTKEAELANDEAAAGIRERGELEHVGNRHSRRAERLKNGLSVTKPIEDAVRTQVAAIAESV